MFDPIRICLNPAADQGGGTAVAPADPPGGQDAATPDSTDALIEKTGQFFKDNGVSEADVSSLTDDQLAQYASPPSKPTDSAAGADAPENGETKPGEKPKAELNEPAKEGQQANPDASALQEARASLKRAKFTDEMLEGLPAERVIAMGKAYQQRENDHQRQFAETQRLRSQLEQILAERDASAGQQDAGDTGLPKGEPDQRQDAAPVDADLDALFTAGLQELADNGYDEIVEPVGKMLRSAVQHASEAAAKPYQEQLAKLENEVQARDSAIEGLQRSADTHNIRMAAKDLEARFPQLKDADTLNRVRDRVYVLANADQQGTIYFDDQGDPKWGDLVADAASAITGSGDPIKEAQARMAESASDYSGSQPTPADGASQGRQTATLTSEQRMTLKAQLLREGKSRDEIDRILKSA